MPKVTETTALDEIVHTLMERRQDLVDQLAEIDQTFVRHGIPVPDQKGNVGRGGGSSSGGGAAAAAAPARTTGKRRGRPPGSTSKSTKKSSKKTSKKTSKAGGRGRGRGGFAQSGEESVLEFIRSAGSPSTREVNDHWTSQGRGGKADNTLTKLVKDGTVKRVKSKDVRGSRYQVA